jgi:hypothetical protein
LPVFLLAIGIFQKTNSFTLKAFSIAAIGWIYISVSWGMMLGLRQTGMIFKGDSLCMIMEGNIHCC